MLDDVQMSMIFPDGGLTPQEEKVLNDLVNDTGVETEDAVKSLVDYGNNPRLYWRGEPGANGKVVKLLLGSQREVVFEWSANEVVNFSRNDYISRFNEGVSRFLQMKEK